MKLMSTSTSEWIRRTRDRTDTERAEAAAPRVWRYIMCWEILRTADGAWVSRGELERQLDISGKGARRTLHHLEATGLIEVRWGVTGKKTIRRDSLAQSFARIKKRKH